MKRILVIVALFASIGAQHASANMRYAHIAADSVYICQSKSAYAYHAYECRGLARCTHHVAKITRAQAIKLGYKPCKICY